MKRPVFLLLAVLVIGGAFLLFQSPFNMGQKESEDETGKVGPVQDGIAPNFSLLDLAGKEVALKEVYQRNNLTILNFWATWCPPCRAEIPEFNRFYAEKKENGLTILAVNIQEEAAKVNAFVRAQGMEFPVLLDSAGKVAKTYFVNAIPSTFIIDRQGRIKQVHRGMITYNQLKEVADAYL